jgi:predicted enzyme related to lactoylglutathione lyase
MLTFSTLRMSVRNVAASLDWYRAFFAAEPVESLENFASFRVGGIALDLVKEDEKSPASKGTVGYWLVEDLTALIKRAEELGGRVYRGPLRVKETQRTIVQIEDAHGNVFGLEEVFIVRG